MHKASLRLISLQIVWENCKVRDVGNDCLVTIDGTDCKIPNVKGQEKAFRSHKFKHAGLRYELAVCIATGWIVWLIGPFPCGDWPDIVIFRFALKHLLEGKEQVEADDGYIGDDPLKTKVPKSMVHNHDEKMLINRTKVRRRHETANGRIKMFGCMKDSFRHDISFHGPCYRACAVLVQLAIMHGKPLFQVPEYRDPPAPPAIVLLPPPGADGL